MRLRALLPLALALTCTVMGCKRRRAPAVEEVWDDADDAGRTEAAGTLAPAWPTPVRARLDNGLLVYWLAETGSPAFHLRMLLPAPGRSTEGGPAALAVAAEHLRFDLDRRTTRYEGRVEVEQGPGRIELAVHGDVEDLDGLLDAIGRSVRTPPSATVLERARDRLLDGLEQPDARATGTALLAERLLGVPQLVTPRTVRTLEREALTSGWEALTDPRDAVWLVHTGQDAAGARDTLRKTVADWRGMGRRADDRTGLQRLRAGAAPPKSATQQAPLTGENARPITSAPAPGAPVLHLGRVVPTPDLASRATARLAQRILQESFDVRASIQGDQAVFVMRLPLPRRGADVAVKNALDELSSQAKTRHQTQRLFQAAQLWLGGRVVEASLRGEDWTLLFRSSLDLAESEAKVATALGREATAMLEVEPAALAAWQTKWLDPKGGEPGWDWVVTGADPVLIRQLRRIAEVRPAG